MPTLDDILTGEVSTVEKNVKRISQDLLARITALVNGLQTENGFLTSDTEQLNRLANITTELYAALIDSGYESMIQQSLIDSKALIDPILDDIRSRLPASYAANIGELNRNTINSFLHLQYNGIETVRDGAVDSIKSAIYNNVITGQPQAELAKIIAGETGQLLNHTETQIKTFKREFLQKSEDLVAQDIGFGEDENDIWEYAGAPLQKNSHEECIWALTNKPGTPYFTNDEKNEFEAGGGYPHSEPRWNCAHIFVMTNKTKKEVGLE